MLSSFVRGKAKAVFAAVSIGGIALSIAACPKSDVPGPDGESGRYVFWTADSRILPLTVIRIGTEQVLGQITAAGNGVQKCGSPNGLTLSAPAAGVTEVQIYNLPVFGNANYNLTPITGCTPIEITFSPVQLRVVAIGSGSGRVASGSGAIDCVITNGVTATTGCSSTRTMGTIFSLTATPAAGSTFMGYQEICPGVLAGAICAVTASQAVTTVTAEFTPSAP
jgi:hypothetical protein